MAEASVMVRWPDGRCSTALPGESWLEAARRSGQLIPLACCTGSCGACEIEVNGNVVRACISVVPVAASGSLVVKLAEDPFW